MSGGLNVCVFCDPRLSYLTVSELHNNRNPLSVGRSEMFILFFALHVCIYLHSSIGLLVVTVKGPAGTSRKRTIPTTANVDSG
jgi:hypothetical protein